MKGVDVSRWEGRADKWQRNLIEARKCRAVIDRSYPLEGVVEAHRYVDTQQKTGNVVLTVNGRAKKARE